MTSSLDLNRAILRRYTDQPDSLPDAVREEAERQWDGAPVQLYALSDLDEDLRLATIWVLLGPSEVSLASIRDGATHWTRVSRSAVRDIVAMSGHTCHRMILRADENRPPLAELRYTQRQRRTMDNIRLVLEQDIPMRRSAARADSAYADAVAEPIRNAQAAVKGNDLAMVWRLLSYLNPYRREVIVGFVTAILVTLVSLVPPYLTGSIIDRVTETPPGSALSPDLARSLWWTLAMLSGAFAVRSLCVWIRLRFMSRLGEFVAHDLRRDIYRHLQTLSLAFFSRKQSGSIISRCSSDTDRLWDFVAFGILEFSVSCLMLLGLGVVLLCLDWRLGLVLTLPVPIFLWAFHHHGRRINRFFLRSWQKWSQLTSVLSGTVPGIWVVKAFNQENREIGRFDQRNDAYLDAANQVHGAWTTFWPGIMLGFHVLTLLIWTFGLPRLAGSVQPPLSAGTFVAFLLYMAMFMHPLEVIGQITRMMNRALSSAYRVFEILDTEPAITHPPQATCPVPLCGAIRFENVSFSYDGLRTVLREIDFDVKPGEMIGLVGPSGSGKTTITNLMARFYDTTSGRILIDGIDIRDLELGGYRRQLGMVLQDPFLFHGSIFDNIAYGLPEPELQAVIAAAKAANAHDFITRFDQGYETIIGERGQTLSGGERQRVSIARAILHDPRVLILDEATSNVDTETERSIQSALQRLIHGRTVIAIAHRLSTLKRAHRLLVIQDGKLVESGTHEELLGNPNGVFARLHRIQTELHEQFAI